MACRPAFLIALLLATFCLLLPACRQTPRTSLPQSQTALTKRNLSVAIYRFWSGAVPFCEQYFQFAAQKKQPTRPKLDAAICGEKLAELHGCRRHFSESVRSDYPNSVWVRINYVDNAAQSSSHQSCRYKDHLVVM